MKTPATATNSIYIDQSVIPAMTTGLSQTSTRASTSVIPILRATSSRRTSGTSTAKPLFELYDHGKAVRTPSAAKALMKQLRMDVADPRRASTSANSSSTNRELAANAC